MSVQFIRGQLASQGSKLAQAFEIKNSAEHQIKNGQDALATAKREIAECYAAIDVLKGALLEAEKVEKAHVAVVAGLREAHAKEVAEVQAKFDAVAAKQVGGDEKVPARDLESSAPKGRHRAAAGA